MSSSFGAMTALSQARVGRPHCHRLESVDRIVTGSSRSKCLRGRGMVQMPWATPSSSSGSRTCARPT
jgi:hypothetical protein